MNKRLVNVEDDSDDSVEWGKKSAIAIQKDNRPPQPVRQPPRKEPGQPPRVEPEQLPVKPLQLNHRKTWNPQSLGKDWVIKLDEYGGGMTFDDFQKRPKRAK